MRLSARATLTRPGTNEHEKELIPIPFSRLNRGCPVQSLCVLTYENLTGLKDLSGLWKAKVAGTAVPDPAFILSIERSKNR